MNVRPEGLSGLESLGPGGLIALAAFSLLMSAFFSGSETGYMSISRVRLRNMPGSDKPMARRLLNLLQRIDDPILTCLIGTNLFNVFFTALVTAEMVGRFGARGEWIAVGVVSTVVILVGEIVPKVLFREFPEHLTLATVPAVSVAMWLMGPVRWLLRAYFAMWNRVLPAAKHGRSGLSRRSLAALLLTNTVPNDEERRFADAVDRFLELEEQSLSSLMRPLDSLVTVGPDVTIGECLAVAAKLGFSRFPVSREDGRELRGYVLVRDLLFLDPQEHHRLLPRGLIRSLLLVDERLSPYELFEELQSQGRQIATVVDASGNPLGMITLEDLIETVVGSIQDEFDPPVDRQGIFGQITVHQGSDHGKQ